MAVNKSKSGKDEFFILQHYSNQLITLFQQSITQPNPALFLYNSKARTPLFMVESLVRVLRVATNDRQMKDTGKIIKKLEDLLGRIDDQDCLYQRFTGYKAVGKKQLAFFKSKRDKALLKLNKKLKKHNYYQDVFNAIISRIKINFNDEKLILKLEEEMKWELKAALYFFMQYPTGFQNMESQVHELRRKLRWISIYGQSLQGIATLANDKKIYDWENEFVQAKVKHPGYNKLPVKKDLVAHIQISKKAFYALNYVVECLGEIKDKGLAMEALHKAIIKTKTIDNKHVDALVTKELNLTYTEKELLKEAHLLLHKFFVSFKIQDALLMGVKTG